MRPLTFVQNVFSWEGIQLNMPEWCQTHVFLLLQFWWMRTMRSSTATLCHSCTIWHILYMAEQPSLTSIPHHCPGADSLLRIYRPETSERHGAVQPRSPGQGSARWGISESLQYHGDREIPPSVLSWIVSVEFCKISLFLISLFGNNGCSV